MLSLPDLDWYLDNVVLPAGPPDDRSLTAVQRWHTLWADRAAELRHAEGPRAVVADVALRQGFVLTTAQARAAGVDESEQRRRLRSGQWSWVRRSVLTPIRVQDRESHLLLAAAGAVLVRPGVVSATRAGRSRTAFRSCATRPARW